jgi:hypothetical protein
MGAGSALRGARASVGDAFDPIAETTP